MYTTLQNTLQSVFSPTEAILLAPLARYASPLNTSTAGRIGLYEDLPEVWQ